MFESIINQESFNAVKNIKVTASNSNEQVTTLFNSNIKNARSVESITQSALCDLLLFVAINYAAKNITQLHVNQIMSINSAYDNNTQNKRIIKHYYDNRTKLKQFNIVVTDTQRQVITFDQKTRDYCKAKETETLEFIKTHCKKLHEFITKNDKQTETKKNTVLRKKATIQKQQTATEQQNEVVNK